MSEHIRKSGLIQLPFLCSLCSFGHPFGFECYPYVAIFEPCQYFRSSLNKSLMITDYAYLGKSAILKNGEWFFSMFLSDVAKQPKIMRKNKCLAFHLQSLTHSNTSTALIKKTKLALKRD